MNIGEINPGTNGTLGHYFAAAIPLTVVTILFIMWQYHNLKRKTASRFHTDVGLSAAMFESGRSESASKKKWWPSHIFSSSYWTQKENVTRQPRGSIVKDESVQ